MMTASACCWRISSITASSRSGSPCVVHSMQSLPSAEAWCSTPLATAAWNGPVTSSSISATVLVRAPASALACTFTTKSSSRMARCTRVLVDLATG